MEIEVDFSKHKFSQIFGKISSTFSFSPLGSSERMKTNHKYTMKFRSNQIQNERNITSMNSTKTFFKTSFLSR